MAKVAKGSDHIIGRSPTGSDELSHVLHMLTSAETKGRRSRPYGADAGLCATKNWLHINTEPGEVITAPTLKLYQGIGVGVEDVVVEGFKAHGKILSTQVKLPTPPKTYGIDVGGYLDILAYDHLGRVAAYEVKTCTSIPNEPKPNHLAQAMTYAALGGLDIVYILYISRSVQAFPSPAPLVRVFEIDVQNLLEHYMSVIVLSCHSLHDSAAPMRPTGFRKSYECNYCPFQQKCWNEDGFRFTTPTRMVQKEAAALKIAGELIALRPHFFLDTLSNAIGSAHEDEKPKIIELMAQAKAALRGLKLM